MDRRHTATRQATSTGTDRAADHQAWRAALGAVDDQAVLDAERVQARLEHIGRRARSVRTAWALLDTHQIPPVPLDPKLEPAGDPLDTVEAVLDHYDTHPDHGVGITTGPHPSRPWTYLAVSVDRFSRWNEWLRSVAETTETVRDLGGFADTGHEAEVGPATERKIVREAGSFSRLLWTPPPLPRMKVYPTDATGGPLARLLDSRRKGQGGWIWLVVPTADVKVPRGRKVAAGIKLQRTGTVVPWEGTRNDDGWTLTMHAAAMSQNGLAPSRMGPPAGWLLDALTSRTPAPPRTSTDGPDTPNQLAY